MIESHRLLGTSIEYHCTLSWQFSQQSRRLRKGTFTHTGIIVSCEKICTSSSTWKKYMGLLPKLITKLTRFTKIWYRVPSQCTSGRYILQYYAFSSCGCWNFIPYIFLAQYTIGTIQKYSEMLLKVLTRSNISIPIRPYTEIKNLLKLAEKHVPYFWALKWTVATSCLISIPGRTFFFYFKYPSLVHL